MEYPHINDTKFPNINTVDVYQFENVFDYARYTGKVAVKLCNVLWNSNYADVVKFDDDSARDIWFDNLSGIVKALETGFVFAPEMSLRIPIPYMDAYRYNYLVVKVPMITSENEPVDYENENERINTWYFFIDSMTRYATNTTELYLTLDVWTQFANTVDIPYLMLERGHAPMTQISVENYLANPIVNNEYLLAPDFNFGNDSIIQTSNYVPIGNGEKYVVFCAPYRKEDFDDFGGSAWSGNSTPATYSNEQSRWGYQLHVSDYDWKFDSADYSNADLPISNRIQTGVLNGCECFAILGSEALSFFNDCANNCVNFIHGIQAMFILDETLINFRENFTFRNKTIFVVDQKDNTWNFALNKSMFGYDANYANIAKLYTMPYAELEITDDNGNSFTAKVENTGHIQMVEEVSLVYPFLNYNVLFNGINGDGSMQYQWKNVQGTTQTHEIWASDFSKFMMNWEVPVYGIYVSAENEYAANNFSGIEAKRQRAIMEYRNAMRYGNTTNENVKDSMQTNTDNVAANGATNTTNVNNSTSTMVANVGRTQAGLKSNMQDTNTAMNTKVDDLLDGGNISQIGGSGGYLSDTYDAQLNKLSDDNDADVILMYQIQGLQATFIAASAVTNAAGSIAGGISQGSIAGAELAGVPGATVGAIGGAVAGTVQTAAGTMIALTENASLNTVNVQHANAKFRNARDNAMALVTAQKAYNGGVKNVDNALRKTTTERFSDTLANNGINNVNANADKNTQDTNATNTQNTNNANASRTQTTESNNATYNKYALENAEKAKMAQAQLEAESQFKNARLQAPAMYGKYSGDFLPDAYHRRGVRFNVRTQSKSAIKQAGDAFLRFGYAIHRVWDMANGLHYGRHFTFWKAEDIWINEGNGLAGNMVNQIGDIFLKGVTVWSNPDEVGKVSIYDNL